MILFSFLTLLTPQADEGRVFYYGALKAMMHGGDLSARVALAQLESPHLYALGALVGLKGEILIWNGKPFISMVKERHLALENHFEYEAALLVGVRVSRWQKSNVPQRIKDLATLEDLVGNKAERAGWDGKTPFPFLIEGRAHAAAWHVIDWEEGDEVHTPAKHKNSGLKGAIEGEVAVLGFFSVSHQGIFTHHGARIHAHVMSPDGRLAGHLDGLDLAEGALLSLPFLTKEPIGPD